MVRNEYEFVSIKETFIIKSDKLNKYSVDIKIELTVEGVEKIMVINLSTEKITTIKTPDISSYPNYADLF